MTIKHRIAIVGGGSVGTSFLHALVTKAIERSTNNLGILLFEPQPLVGPGYAYQADFACNLLNTRADTMSAVAAEKDHFIRWLQANEAAWRPDFSAVRVEPSEFLPRELFGRYLAAVHDDAVVGAETHGIGIVRIPDQVLDLISIHHGQICVDTKASGAFVVDRAVICMGNLPSTNFEELIGTPGYFHCPYPCRSVADQVPKDTSVCVLGTNLSAIDTVLSLAESGHRGKIVCVSRNGRLPSVRSTLNRGRILKRLTREQIDDLANLRGGHVLLSDVALLLKEEIEAATGESFDLDEVLNYETGTYDYISTEITLSARQERLWQSVIYATNGVIDYVWHRLSLEDKRRFHSAFRSLWMSYRVSFPLGNALKVRELLRTEKIAIYGGFSAVRFDAESGLFQIRMQDKRSGMRYMIECQHLVNATSYSTDVARSSVPLIRNLLSRGLAKPSEFGGFDVDYSRGTLIGVDGKRWDNVSVLGSLACGTYFWTNAMDVNARLSAVRAAQIVDESSKRDPHIIPHRPQSTSWLERRTPAPEVKLAG